MVFPHGLDVIAPKTRFLAVESCRPVIIDLCTPPRRKVVPKAEVIDLILSPLRPGVKRKPVPKSPQGTKTVDIDLCSPPRAKAKIEKTEPVITRLVMPAPGAIVEGRTYDTEQSAVDDIFYHEEQRGHKWALAQRDPDTSGQTKKRTVRCNHYRAPQIPDTRFFSTLRTIGKGRPSELVAWHALTLIAPRVQGYGGLPLWIWSTTMHVRSRRAVWPVVLQASIIRTFERPLEDRQISNLLNKARRDNRASVDALGGDTAAILQDLERFNQSEPGWNWRVRLDTEQVLTGLWWQSPRQAALARRFSDILINDNTYNRNRSQLPLNIALAPDRLLLAPCPANSSRAKLGRGLPRELEPSRAQLGPGIVRESQELKWRSGVGDGKKLYTTGSWRHPPPVSRKQSSLGAVLVKYSSAGNQPT
ncbi:hypothetical protein DFH06DRAFT_1360469 [Mycena polygramma]|nr:hypothetical protein DFH06DRAFT_1360469 [Mycena polygramma]